MTGSNPQAASAVFNERVALLPPIERQSAHILPGVLLSCGRGNHAGLENNYRGPRGGGHSEESTLHNCDGGDFVVGESGNGELQQLLVHAEGWALLCLEQLDRSHRNS